MSATLKADDFANYFNKVKLGAQNGNYRDYRGGLYWHNGKENGNY